MNSRNQSLDVLRGIAVLMVIVRHLPYSSILTKVGWAGVDLFFVLSGFLISGLLFTEYSASRAIDFKRFILRRGLKIWPAFYVFVAIIGVIVCGYHAGPWRALLLPSLFLQNYLTSPSSSLVAFGHTWSLAVEEHFYLFLPLLLFVLMKFKPSGTEPFRSVPAIFVLIAALCLTLRLFNDGDPWATHLRMDKLFAGVTLGYWYHFRRSLFSVLVSRYSLLLTFLCCLPLLMFDHDSRFMQTIGLTILPIGFGFLVAWAAVRKAKGLAGIACRGLAFIGFYSYSIYLWQEPITILLRNRVKESLPIFILSIALCISIGIIMAKIIELPVLRLRDRLLPSPTKVGFQLGLDSHEVRPVAAAASSTTDKVGGWTAASLKGRY